MSSLISSYFIDPVVRQARRFSASQGTTPPPPAQGTRLPAGSHANDAHGTAVATTQYDCAAIAEVNFLPAQVGDRALHNHVDSPAEQQIELDRERNAPDSAVTDRQDIALEDAFGAVEAAPAPEHATAVISGGDHIPSQSQPQEVPELDLPDAPQDADADMPPRTSRSSSARDIPRPLMSLREDSPSQAGQSLPADDGMRLMRAQIVDIHQSSASQTEKARRMHALMTEEWQAAQNALRPQSPASMISQDRMPAMPSSPLSTITSPASPQSTMSVPAYAPPLDPRNPFNVQPEDLQPSFRPLPDTEEAPVDDGHDDHPAIESLEPAEPDLGCKHYKRNVKIQCFDCREWHACRHCHDGTVTTHHLNRRATENMLCQLCWTPQPAAQYCGTCGERAAWYYCDICKLWDDDASKRIYHCPDCGICRRGEGLGKDFVHCKKCNVCISIQHYSTHTCIENATDSNCPLCLDYMFTSPLEIVAMPCGHYLHHHCYTSLMLSTYQCPICKRSAVNMETQWRKLEDEIRHQPMPAEWRDVKAEVKCNDCGSLSVSQFHWLGIKCSRCDGFNTNQVRLLAGDDVSRDVQDFAEERRERRAEQHANGNPPPFQRTVTAPVVVRPYFLGPEDVPNRPRSASRGYDGFANAFVLPDFPRMPEFSGRLPNLPQFRPRLPSMPTMPNIPNMPGMPSLPGLDSIRHYFDDQIIDGVPRQWRGPEYVRTSAEGESGDWRANEDWFVESSEDDDDDEEDYSDEDEEMEDDNGEVLDPVDEMDQDIENDLEANAGVRLDLDPVGHR